MKKAKIVQQMIKEQGLSNRSFAEKAGIPPTTLQSMITRGIGKASIDNVIKVCHGLGISIDELERRSNEDTEDYQGRTGIEEFKLIPILGTIAAGQPILAQENIEDYECIAHSLGADFCLKVKGDSMINARILNGDIVYIRQQSDIENGEIAAVLIDNEEATLKRVYKINGTVILRAENPNYKDIVFSGNDINRLYIFGKAISFRSSIE